MQPMVVSRPLGRYRVVELGGVSSMHAGRIFADLGARVVRVEPPDGDPARALPPLDSQTGTSLLWTSMNLGKEVVTAEVGDEHGSLKELLADADVLLEERIRPFTNGLIGTEIRREHPQLIHTVISPFGLTGPFARYHGSDLVAFARGGYLYMTGPPDGSPLKPSAPYQMHLHAGTHAVAATLLALRRRARGGRGGQVDQAMRDTGPWMLTHTYQHFDLLRVNLRRQGSSRDMGTAVRLRSVYRCADGYIVWLFLTGHVGAGPTQELLAWMEAERQLPDWIREISWESFDLRSNPEYVPRLQEAFETFFRTKTKAELFRWALPRGVMLAPVQSLEDVLEDPQLDARGSWEPLDEPRARLPRGPVQLSGATWAPRTGTVK